MTRAAEPVSADFERREPRCRICRDETVRILVNELLDWRGVPVIRGRGKIHRITLTEILRDLAPLNEGRDKAVTRRTRSPTTASGSTPSVTTALPGEWATGAPGCPRSSGMPWRAMGCRTPIEQPQRKWD